MNASEMNTDRLVADLKQVMKDSGELLEATAGTVSDKAQDARQRLAQVMDKAARTCHDLEQKAIDGAKAADHVVREHPYQSMGVAFGVGVVIGVLLSRK